MCYPTNNGFCSLVYELAEPWIFILDSSPEKSFGFGKMEGDSRPVEEIQDGEIRGAEALMGVEYTYFLHYNNLIIHKNENNMPSYHSAGVASTSILSAETLLLRDL